MNIPLHPEHGVKLPKVAGRYRTIYSGYCLECGSLFYTLSNSQPRCSLVCGRRGRKSKSVIERFWKYVIKKDGCWEWLGSTSRGYGHLNLCDGKWMEAHRLSWIIHNGEIPKGMCVLHRCDNPPCNNPKHLWLGTKRDNFMDAIKKGRRTYGKHTATP